MLQSLETEILKKGGYSVYEYDVGDIVSVTFHGNNAEGQIIKIYSSGAVLLHPLYISEKLGYECIVVQPEDIKYVIELEEEMEEEELPKPWLITLMEIIMPLEYWCLAPIGLSILIFLIQQLI